MHIHTCSKFFAHSFTDIYTNSLHLFLTHTQGWSCCKKRSTDFTDFLHIPVSPLHASLICEVVKSSCPGSTDVCLTHIIHLLHRKYSVALSFEHKLNSSTCSSFYIETVMNVSNTVLIWVTPAGLHYWAPQSSEASGS